MNLTDDQKRVIAIRARELRLNATHAANELANQDYDNAKASLLAAQIHLKYILAELSK